MGVYCTRKIAARKGKNCPCLEGKEVGPPPNPAAARGKERKRRLSSKEKAPWHWGYAAPFLSGKGEKQQTEEGEKGEGRKNISVPGRGEKVGLERAFSAPRKGKGKDEGSSFK